jgi:predicted O-linked N-acetylglucosamine transferase (SPINDLY family)
VSRDNDLKAAILAHNNHNISTAARLYEKIIRKYPSDIDAIHNFGLLRYQQKNYVQALYLLRRAISIGATDVNIANSLATVLHAMGDLSAALNVLEKAISINSGYFPLHYSIGNVLRDQNRYDEAISAYMAAIKLNPSYEKAYNNLGSLYLKIGRIDDAVSTLTETVRLFPQLAEPYDNLGRALSFSGKSSDGILYASKACKMAPDNPAFKFGLGFSLFKSGDDKNAVFYFRQALEMGYQTAALYSALGAALYRLKEFAPSLDAYNHATQLDSADIDAMFSALYVKRHCCDWEGFEGQERRAIDAFRAYSEPVNEFCLLAMSSATAQDLLDNARRRSQAFARIDAVAPVENRREGKIKLGYLSADFHSHATAYLAAGLFECHDRARFHVSAFSCGPDDKSPMRDRLENAFDDFVDLRELSHREAAAKIRDAGIDILIDLKGYTAGHRIEILAMRPAPIQINYLGYPGSMGAPFIDYIVADEVVIPPYHQKYYDEDVIYMPHSYQVNDRKRDISAVPSREGCGLPVDGVVFCCFNNSFKITPDDFSLWMNILSTVENSVIWLYEANPIAMENLRREAEIRGIAAVRLVFGKPLPLADHLARLQLADLFLDTLPCNAHTTASDALWAGVPVLTRLGETFAGRVAASLLHAIGLPELVASSSDEYQQLAIKFAMDPELLSEKKRRLVEARLTTPLFDTLQWTRDFEERMVTLYKVIEH